MPISVLKIKALPQPIENESWMEVEYSCAECGTWGTIRVTDGQWREMLDKPIESYLCAKCGGRERSDSEKLKLVGKARA
jgi:DNA-directed RNA polymerase subunit RPC12/RpoP